MPQLRQNLVTGEFVVIAPERAKRPQDFIRPKPHVKPEKDCLFCPGGKVFKNEKPKPGSTKNVRVIANKYPAFVKKHPIVFAASNIYYSSHSVGEHEVVFFKDHDKDFSRLDTEQIKEIFQVYQNRYQKISKNPNIEYINIIHNHGKRAGASVVHPHSQIFAPSIIPNLVLRELWGSERYLKDQGHCVFCDIVREEKQQNSRIIAESDHFIAFAAFAPRMPFEIWISPKEHLVSFEKFSPQILESLSEIFLTVFRKIDDRLSDPDYNFYFHVIPTKHDHISDHYHFHIEILPRLSVWGGFELGSGISIDIVSPEKAAKFLNAD